MQHIDTRAGTRLDWIDGAKGIAIALVVLVHVQYILSLLGLPTSTTYWTLLDATSPMRMPGFFLISGLFVHRFLSTPSETFQRKRVLSFLYLFGVWAAITLAVERLWPFWLGADEAATVARSDLGIHFLRLETPLWYLVALPAFHLLWWGTRRLPAVVPLAATGVAWLAIDIGWLELPGLWNSTGLRGMVQFAFFFMVGARLSTSVRAAVSRLRPLSALAVLGAWVAYWGFVPEGRLTPLLAVPALFAAASLLTATRLRPWLLLLGRRTLPLYLMNWLAVSAIAGAWLRIDPPSTPVMQYVVPGVTLVAAVGLMTAVWQVTRRIDWLYVMPHEVGDFLLSGTTRESGVLGESGRNPEVLSVHAPFPAPAVPR